MPEAIPAPPPPLDQLPPGLPRLRSRFPPTYLALGLFLLAVAAAPWSPSRSFSRLFRKALLVHGAVVLAGVGSLVAAWWRRRDPVELVQTREGWQLYRAGQWQGSPRSRDLTHHGIRPSLVVRGLIFPFVWGLAAWEVLQGGYSGGELAYFGGLLASSGLAWSSLFYTHLYLKDLWIPSDRGEVCSLYLTPGEVRGLRADLEAAERTTVGVD